MVETAQEISGCPLHSLKDLNSSCCLTRDEAITRDSTHPAHHLFDLLFSGRRYRSMKTRTNRLRNSFFPQAITALNTSKHWHPPTEHTYTHHQHSRTMCNIDRDWLYFHILLTVSTFNLYHIFYIQLLLLVLFILCLCCLSYWVGCCILKCKGFFPVGLVTIEPYLTASRVLVITPDGIHDNDYTH